MQKQAKRFSTNVGAHEITIETGKLAGQADGAVTISVGDTMIFASAVMSSHTRDGIDFFPLSVDYEERLYAAGKIPGSFLQEAGRISLIRSIALPLKLPIQIYLRSTPTLQIRTIILKCLIIAEIF